MNSSSFETECFVASDGLTLYFASERNGGLGQHDLYRATRSDLSGEFGDVTLLEELSTSDGEGRLTSWDGLEGFFWSDRGGGLGGSDIWTVTRPDQLTPFTNASAIALSSSTTSDDYDPWLATDGLHVYFTTSDSDLSMGSYDIVVASRASLNAPFGRPVPVAGINSTSVDDNPTLSSDGLLLVFSSERPGGAGSGDLYYAQRASTTDAFSEPLPLVDLNTPYEDYEPCLTRQGELYFSSNRPGGSGADDIYRTRIVPVM